MQLLLLSFICLGVLALSSCRNYPSGSPHSGGGSAYSNGGNSEPSYARKIHPRQHGRHKDGFRTHAEKKYYRPF